MGRYQRLYVFHANGAFHIRYYVTELVPGKPEQVQKSEGLRSKDNKHHGTTCKAVRCFYMHRLACDFCHCASAVCFVTSINFAKRGMSR